MGHVTTGGFRNVVRRLYTVSTGRRNLGKASGEVEARTESREEGAYVLTARAASVSAEKEGSDEEEGAGADGKRVVDSGGASGCKHVAVSSSGSPVIASSIKMPAAAASTASTTLDVDVGGVGVGGGVDVVVIVVARAGKGGLI